MTPCADESSRSVGALSLTALQVGGGRMLAEHSSSSGTATISSRLDGGLSKATALLSSKLATLSRLRAVPPSRLTSELSPVRGREHSQRQLGAYSPLCDQVGGEANSHRGLVTRPSAGARAWRAASSLPRPHANPRGLARPSRTNDPSTKVPPFRPRGGLRP